VKLRGGPSAGRASPTASTRSRPPSRCSSARRSRSRAAAGRTRH
jgi:hypothetical protein